MTGRGRLAAVLTIALGLSAACGTTVPPAAPTPLPTPAGPKLACGELELAECRTVAAAAVPGGIGASEIVVERFVAACIRAQLCMHPFGGWPWSHKVSVTRADGAVDVLVCTRAEPPVCGPAPAEEAAALARVTVHLAGAKSREVQMEASGGTTYGFAVEGRHDKILMADTYRFSARFEDDPECPCTYPVFRGTPPPDWCSVVLAAKAGGEYELTITVADGRCTMELVDRGGDA